MGLERLDVDAMAYAASSSSTSVTISGNSSASLAAFSTAISAVRNSTFSIPYSPFSKESSALACLYALNAALRLEG